MWCRYGYATNTRVKFILVVENTTSQSRDTEMKMVGTNWNTPQSHIDNMQLFKNLHVAYADMLCNPFYTPGQKITSRYIQYYIAKV